MAVGTSRKISAASARAHTRRSNRGSSPKFFSGIVSKVILILFVGVLAWAYKAIQPVQPKICGSPGGPPITSPRIKLRDGRHLAYREQGVPKDDAKFKVIFIHGFRSSCRYVSDQLPTEVANELGVYGVSFDRPGYGESDPHPERSLKSLAMDVEELADKLKLGSKFYVVGLSMGGAFSWACIKYIPHRLAGVSLLSPAVNYWWQSLPANLSKEVYLKQAPADQWALRVAHYAPWLTYWWNTQRMFPISNVIAQKPIIFSHQDKEIIARAISVRKEKLAEDANYSLQLGEFESLHRELIIAFGKWDFDPLTLENPFPNNEASVHLWQGDDDLIVPVELQRYTAQKLSWIHYHELAGAGHLFSYSDGLPYAILKAMFSQQK